MRISPKARNASENRAHDDTSASMVRAASMCVRVLRVYFQKQACTRANALHIVREFKILKRKLISPIPSLSERICGREHNFAINVYFFFSIPNYTTNVTFVSY